MTPVSGQRAVAGKRGAHSSSHYVLLASRANALTVTGSIHNCDGGIGVRGRRELKAANNGARRSLLGEEAGAVTSVNPAVALQRYLCAYLRNPLIAYQVPARKLLDIGYFVNVVPGWCQA